MRVNPQEVCPINSSTGFEIRAAAEKENRVVLQKKKSGGNKT